MSETLYRKYRPQSFADLAGQNHIKITLQNELSGDRLAHAYLFGGPRGVGKTTTARIFAKAVNCTQRKAGESEPCNTCAACLEVINGQSLDLIEIDAASHTGVDHVRDQIIDNARFTPSRWKYKVFIIDEVHMLSTAAFNALLKTLEEPPQHALFVLCTTELHKLPETIISRCQRFDFKKISQADLLQRMQMIVKAEKKSVDESVLVSIIRQAEGASRDAESLLGQVLTLGDTITADQAEIVLPRSHADSVVALFEAVVRRNTAAALGLINQLADQGVNMTQFARELLEFLRFVMLVKVGGPTSAGIYEITAEREDQVRKLTDDIELERVTRWINALIDRERDLKYSEIPQLPLELITIEACGSETPDEPPRPPLGGSAATVANRPAAPQTPTPVAPKPAGAGKKAPHQLEDIKARWSEVHQQVQQDHPTVALAFKLAQPVELNDDELVLGCQYPIHAERLKHAGTKAIIEKVLEGFFGFNYRINSRVEEPADDSSANDAGVSPLLEALGGEVVG